MKHATVVRLAEMRDVMVRLAELIDELLEEELESLPDSPDGWARPSDIALILGVSDTPARNWMVRNGAIKNPSGMWEMPWTHAMSLINDPTVRKPKPRPGSRGIAKNPEGR